MAVAIPFVLAAATVYSVHAADNAARNAQDAAKKQKQEQDAAAAAAAAAAPVAMPTQTDTMAAQRKSLADLAQRQGRASTILSDVGNQPLGGT
jgi:hypothetical protein